MRMSKKKMFVTALAICLIAILSLGTLAWFNASADVTNKFMVADSTDDGTTPDFSVEVWENENDGNDNVDQDAADGDGGDNRRDITYEGNEYPDILPGDVLAKNPTVENTGLYDQWIRVLVTVENYGEIQSACEAAGIVDDVDVDIRSWLQNKDGTGIDTDVWEVVADPVGESGADTRTYVYYYKGTTEDEGRLEPGKTITLFEQVKIPYQFEQDDMSFTDAGFSINVKAQALQADNTGNTAQTAFATVGWTVDKENPQQ